MPRLKAVPGSFNGKEANEEEMSLKLARNFSCSLPVGSKLIIILPITFRVNCNKSEDSVILEDKEKEKKKTIRTLINMLSALNC